LPRLTILRHGHAADAPANGRDFDRPLIAAGLIAAKAAARQMAAALPRVQRLRVSPAQRTRQTAEALCEVGFPGLAPDFVPALYNASLATLLAEVAATPEQCQHLVLVGHNPALSELAGLLSQDPAFNGLSPAQWVSFELGERWLVT
jgi:phosphohistidine phosphatase